MLLVLARLPRDQLERVPPKSMASRTRREGRIRRSVRDALLVFPFAPQPCSMLDNIPHCDSLRPHGLWISINKATTSVAVDTQCLSDLTRWNQVTPILVAESVLNFTYICFLSVFLKDSIILQLRSRYLAYDCPAVNSGSINSQLSPFEQASKCYCASISLSIQWDTSFS